MKDSNESRAADYATCLERCAEYMVDCPECPDCPPVNPPVSGCGQGSTPSINCGEQIEKLVNKPELRNDIWVCPTEKCKLTVQGNFFFKLADVFAVANAHGFTEVDIYTQSNGYIKTSPDHTHSVCIRQDVGLKGGHMETKAEVQAAVEAVRNDLMDDNNEYKYYLYDPLMD